MHVTWEVQFELFASGFQMSAYCGGGTKQHGAMLTSQTIFEVTTTFCFVFGEYRIGDISVVFAKLCRMRCLSSCVTL